MGVPTSWSQTASLYSPATRPSENRDIREHRECTRDNEETLALDHEKPAFGQEQTVASRFQGVRERVEGGHLLARPGNTTKL